MKVIDIIEATQMRDLEAGKHADTLVPAAAAGAGAIIGAGAAVDQVTKRAGKLNRRFRGESVLKTAVKRVLPAIARRQAGKALPYIGLVAGLYFGAASAMKGDLLGAGLEVASSLPWAGLLASTAAISIAVAREVYDDVYEDPANPRAFKSLEGDLRDDFDGTMARIKEIAGYIKDGIDEQLEQARMDIDAKKDVGNFMNDQRKSVKSAGDINWSPDQPATGNVAQARKAFNQRQRTGQEYK